MAEPKRAARQDQQIRQWKADAASLTDSQIRLKIKILRSVILERKQRRAAEKMNRKTL